MVFFFGSEIWLFIQTNLNSFHPKMLCTKFGWKCTSGSGEDKNVKNLQTDGWITGDRRSSLEISAQVSQKTTFLIKMKIGPFQITFFSTNQKIS